MVHIYREHRIAWSKSFGSIGVTQRFLSLWRNALNQGVKWYKKRLPHGTKTHRNRSLCSAYMGHGERAIRCELCNVPDCPASIERVVQISMNEWPSCGGWYSVSVQRVGCGFSIQAVKREANSRLPAPPPSRGLHKVRISAAAAENKTVICIPQSKRCEASPARWVFSHATGSCISSYMTETCGEGNLT